jgi:hypothetical protein
MTLPDGAGWFDWETILIHEEPQTRVIVKWNSTVIIKSQDHIVYRKRHWGAFKRIIFTVNNKEIALLLLWFPIISVTLSSGGSLTNKLYWKDSFTWAIKCSLLGFTIGLPIALILTFFEVIILLAY